MVKTRIEWALEKELFFPWTQTGFRKAQGTQNAQALLTTEINLAFSENLLTLAIFLDIKAAYDHVDIFKLYNKLIEAKIPSELANLILKILAERKLFSKNRNGKFLGPVLTNSGLPQGSPISTMLFNVYIRDIFFILPPGVKIIGYADDLVVYIKGRNALEMTEIMSNALNTICNWLSEHNLKLSTTKCEPILFTKNPRSTNLPTIVINGTNLNFKNEVKYLGIILQKNLKWNKYIDLLIAKTQKGINIMKIFSRVWWGADPKSLLMVYNGLIKSHLDFASIFIKPCNRTFLRKLDTVQMQAIRMALGCMRSTPTNALLAEAAEFDLENRRKTLATQFIDSQAAIGKIKNTDLHPLRDYMSIKTRRLLLIANNNGSNIAIAWIPGHSQIEGNDIVDKLANIVSKGSTVVYFVAFVFVLCCECSQ
ncbi:hypothetical protein HUJ04_011372 [Dendroctonus ponderosae]|nr:hypothetical protein HUJ04_011372 [Dendroctonus ponderosae]